MKSNSPSTEPLHIGIVGAGAAGLIATKVLTDQGFRCTTFEGQGGPGGVYRNCYEGATLTSSSVWTSFSHYPPRLAFEDGVGQGDASHPVHWKIPEYLRYLEAFTKREGLDAHIRFNTRVERCERIEGGWVLHTSGEHEGEHRVDRLLVCSGVHQGGFLPDVPGLESFEGEVLDTSRYKTVAPLCTNKRVLVVGGGESAADVSLQVQGEATACALSVRGGAGHVTPRTWGDARRSRELEGRGFPALDTDIGIANMGVPRQWWWLSGWRDIATLGLGGLHRVFRPVGPGMAYNLRRGSYISKQFGTKSAGFSQALLEGAEPKPGIASIDSKGVRFVDGTYFACDVIIFCTGFRHTLPFLSPQDQPPTTMGALDSRSLFKHMFVPGRGDELAFMGFVRPAFGSIPGLAEMQARCYAALLSGEISLPPADKMVETIEADGRMELQRFWAAKDHSALTDFALYLEGMAGWLGCRPAYRDLWRDDKRLFLRSLVCQVSAHRYWVFDPGEMGARVRDTMMRQQVSITATVDLHLFVMAVFLSAIGFDSLRPTSVLPPTRRERLVTRLASPLLVLLLVPSIYVTFMATLYRGLTPYHWHYCLDRLRGRPQGQVDFATAIDPRSLTNRMYLAAVSALTVAFLVAVAPVMVPTLLVFRAMGLRLRASD
jgi:dimethylaniline monooxygenase (N-oxide forming)